MRINHCWIEFFRSFCKISFIFFRLLLFWLHVKNVWIIYLHFLKEYLNICLKFHMSDILNCSINRKHSLQPKELLNFLWNMWMAYKFSFNCREECLVTDNGMNLPDPPSKSIFPSLLPDFWSMSLAISPGQSILYWHVNTCSLPLSKGQNERPIFPHD